MVVKIGKLKIGIKSGIQITKTNNNLRARLKDVCCCNKKSDFDLLDIRS